MMKNISDLPTLNLFRHLKENACFFSHLHRSDFHSVFNLHSCHQVFRRCCCVVALRQGSEVMKLFFMLSSDEHEILNAHK